MLVTGGTGYIGSHLIRALVSEGRAVHLVARNASSLDLLADVLPAITIHRCSSGRDLPDILQRSRPTLVFHLAATQSGPSALDVGALIESNITFGCELVEAMLVAGCRHLVNTGTYWQHFEGREYSPVDLYAATKQAFTDMIQYYEEACGFTAITLKLFDTYGPRDHRPKLMRALQDAARTRKPLPLTPGEQMIDLVYISDVVAAFQQAERMLRATGATSAQYAVRSGRPVSLRELVGRFESIVGRTIDVQWGAHPYRPRQVMTPWEGPTLPGWDCAVDLDTGIRKVVEA